MERPGTRKERKTAAEEQSAFEYNDLSSALLSTMAMSVLLLQLDYAAHSLSKQFYFDATKVHTHTHEMREEEDQPSLNWFHRNKAKDTCYSTVSSFCATLGSQQFSMV